MHVRGKEMTYRFTLKHDYEGKGLNSILYIGLPKFPKKSSAQTLTD